MLSVSDPRHKRPAPKGQRYQMTPEWKASVERRLAELGWTRMHLAAKLKVAKSAITSLLGPKQSASALVPRICQLLDVPMPVHGTDSEIAELVSRLDPKRREALVVILRGMLPPTAVSGSRTPDE